jgi:hypothetical protein
MVRRYSHVQRVSHVSYTQSGNCSLAWPYSSFVLILQQTLPDWTRVLQDNLKILEVDDAG